MAILGLLEEISEQILAMITLRKDLLNYRLVSREFWRSFWEYQQLLAHRNHFSWIYERDNTSHTHKKLDIEKEFQRSLRDGFSGQNDLAPPSNSFRIHPKIPLALSFEAFFIVFLPPEARVLKCFEITGCSRSDALILEKIYEYIGGAQFVEDVSRAERLRQFYDEEGEYKRLDRLLKHEHEFCKSQEYGTTLGRAIKVFDQYRALDQLEIATAIAQEIFNAYSQKNHLHPMTFLSSADRLIECYQEEGQKVKVKATRVMLHVFDALLCTSGPSDPTLLSRAERLIECYQEAGQTEKVKEVLQRIYDAFFETSSPSAPAFSRSAKSLIQCHNEAKRVKEARKVALDTLDLLRYTLPPDASEIQEWTLLLDEWNVKLWLHSLMG